MSSAQKNSDDNNLIPIKQKFEALAIVEPIGIFETDEDGNCLFVNKRWQEIAGMTEEEAMGQCASS